MGWSSNKSLLFFICLILRTCKMNGCIIVFEWHFQPTLAFYRDILRSCKVYLIDIFLMILNTSKLEFVFLVAFLSPFSSLMPFQHCKWKSTHNGCEKCMEWIKIIQRWKTVHFFVHSVKVGEDASGPVFISLCFGQG